MAMADFKELAAKYEAWFQTPHGRYVYQYEREVVLTLARPQAGDRVLDVGCGSGMYMAELCQRGAWVTGLDISPEMLALARARCATFGEQVEFFQGDAGQLPFADETFDKVISVTAMEFFSDPARAFSEMHRVLKPGGRMMVAVLNSWNLWAVQRRIKSRLRKTIFSDARFYSICNLKRLLGPYGHPVWRGAIFLPPWTPRWMLDRAAPFEYFGQKYFPAFGAFLAAAVDKR